MTYRTGTIGEFVRWTKQVVIDPDAARDVPKQWFDSEETAKRRPSPEGLVKLLSEENLALLRVIGAQKPASMQALADLVGRKPSNLSRTLKKLEAAGIVRLIPGAKHTLAPQLLAQRVTLDLDLIGTTTRLSIQQSAPV